MTIYSSLIRDIFICDAVLSFFKNFFHPTISVQLIKTRIITITEQILGYRKMGKVNNYYKGDFPFQFFSDILSLSTQVHLQHRRH